MLTSRQYECSAFIIDTWIDSAAQNRTNIAPQNIPWNILRHLVTETYGGKIDSDHDAALLESIVTTLLTPSAYDSGHRLKLTEEADDAPVVPEGTSFNEYMGWIHALPEREPPSYLGLPGNAEKMLLVGLGKELVGGVSKVNSLLEDAESLVA